MRALEAGRAEGRAWVMGSVPSQVGSTAAHRPALPHRTVPAPLPRPGPGYTAPVNGPTRIVLASASPRRAELLRGLGLSFSVEPADVDESVRAGEAPDALVARLSVAKAGVVAGRHRAALIVAADTTVVVDGEIINKPASDAENAEFIARLAGRDHHVYTGHALRLGDDAESVVVRTTVTFRPLTGDEIERYAATGEGRDKAGGYAIQGRGAALIERIDGCYSNVVGLSLPTVVTAAARLGVTLV